MSLILSKTQPEGTEAKSLGKMFPDFPDLKISVPIRKKDVESATHQNGKKNEWISVEMPFEDFCELTKYIMTNTELTKDDPRMRLVSWFHQLQTVEGFNGKGTWRLETKDA